MGIGSDMRLFTECPPLPPPTVAEVAVKLSITACDKWNKLHLAAFMTPREFMRDGAGKLWYWSLDGGRPSEPTASDLAVYVTERKAEILRRRESGSR
jgi:hypothetical protein